MPSNFIIILVAFLVADSLIMPFVLRAIIRRRWRPLPDAHPALPPDPEAVTRRYQPFQVGMMSLPLHASVDERCLHLTTVRPLRWLGVVPVSIPWEAITVRARKGARLRVEVAGIGIEGPAWCLELAEPE